MSSRVRVDKWGVNPSARALGAHLYHLPYLLQVRKLIDSGRIGSFCWRTRLYHYIIQTDIIIEAAKDSGLHTKL